LYNLAADPLEKNNLAKSDPARVNRMKREIENWFDSISRDLRSARSPAGGQFLSRS